MNLNLTDVTVEENERQYIKYTGEALLKVVKVTVGKTQTQNDQIKVHFQDKQGLFIIESFTVVPQSLWAIKILVKALGLPEVINTDNFIGRYVNATIKEKKTQNGIIYVIDKYSESKLNEPLNIQPVQQQEANNDYVHNVNIDNDEIPF